jgi:20S proteasome subunit alpha 7
MLISFLAPQVSSGLVADGRHLAKRGREEAESFRDQYGTPMTLKVRLPLTLCPYHTHQPTYSQALIERVAMYEHAYTCYGSVRPFGISTIVAGVDKTGPQLFVVEPSGSYYGYRASAVGKGRQLAKTELEKLDLADITVKQGVMEVARM